MVFLSLIILLTNVTTRGGTVAYNFLLNGLQRRCLLNNLNLWLRHSPCDVGHYPEEPQHEGHVFLLGLRATHLTLLLLNPNHGALVDPKLSLHSIHYLHERKSFRVVCKHIRYLAEGDVEVDGNPRVQIMMS